MVNAVFSLPELMLDPAMFISEIPQSAMGTPVVKTYYRSFGHVLCNQRKQHLSFGRGFAWTAWTKDIYRKLASILEKYRTHPIVYEIGATLNKLGRNCVAKSWLA